MIHLAGKGEWRVRVTGAGMGAGGGEMKTVNNVCHGPQKRVPALQPESVFLAFSVLPVLFFP